MRIGIGLPTVVPGVTGAGLLAWSRRAEEHGFDALATTDHVAYPGLDPLTPLAAAAGVTERIELLTYVVVAPLRDPVLLAKQAAAVDVLSDGRLTLGLAVGWRPADFAATGRSLADRGRHFDAGLATMVDLWSGAAPTGDAPACPPLPRGRLPVLIGGTAALAAPRVAEHGDGWVAGLLPPEAVSDEVEHITDAWRSAGRTGEPRIAVCRNVALGAEVQAGLPGAIDRCYDEADPAVRAEFLAGTLTSPEEVCRDLDGYRAAGVDTVVLLPFGDGLDELDRIAAAVG